MTNEERRIRVTIDAKDEQTKKIVGALDSISKSVRKVEQDLSAMAKLQDVFAKVFAFNLLGMGIGQLFQIADSLTMARERLYAFNQDAALTETIMSKLQDTAKMTRQPIDDISNSFARISVATKNLNISTDAQVATNQMLAQTFKLSGATSEMATGGMTQITQAMSRGVLRGQELISVMANNAALASILSAEAKALGKNIYEMGEKGQITMKFFFSVLAKHFDDINTKAKETKGTFQQGLTIAFNEFKIAIDDLNTSIGLSDGFYSSMVWLTENKDIVASALFGIAAGIVAINQAAIVAAGSSAFLAVKGFVTGITLAGTAAAAAIVAIASVAAGIAYLAVNFKQTAIYAELFWNDMVSFVSGFNIIMYQAKIAFRDLLGLDSSDTKKRVQEELDNMKRLESANDGLRKKLDELNKSQEGVKNGAAALGAASASIADAAIPLEQQVAALNLQFNQGRISVQDYNSKLLDLQKRMLQEDVFVKGTKSLEEFNKEMSKNTLAAFSRELEYGLITAEKFDEKVNEFKLEELDRKFSEGKITLQSYRIELAKLNQEGIGSIDSWTTGVGAGIAQASKDIGTASQAIASVTTNAFKSMEDAIFQSTKGSTRAFADMVQAILDDLTRLVIRMAIIRPLTQGVLGLMGGGAGAEAGGGFTNASSVSNQVGAFASGGIVSSPTMFGSAGRLGIAGEAGPEAILPLSKMADGSLGVSGAGSNTVINIINNSGSDVQQSESTGPGGEKVIDILIMGKVKEGIASGAFDKSFQSSYGLRRRGV